MSKISTYPTIDFGDFPIYNFVGGAGFLLGLLVFLQKLKREQSLNDLQKDKLLMIFAISFLAGLFMANVANWFVIDGIMELTIIERFQFGGLSLYPGVLGFIVTSSILLFSFKYDTAKWINNVIPSVILFHSIGRIGCSFAGCCYGVIIDLEIWGTFVTTRFPAREIESLLMMVLFLLTQYVFTKRRLLMYLSIYPLLRFFLEFGRADDRGRLFTDLFSPSQEVSIFLLTVVSLYLLFRYIDKYKRGT